MAMYLVSYWESHTKSYEVEANSKEDACEKVMQSVWGGELKSPDYCYDCGAEAKMIGE